jgi:predicted RNase H-like nuclease (RuvC/YqgF family)
VEAILHGCIERLQKELQKNVAENKQLETALQEKDRDFAKLEFEVQELHECIVVTGASNPLLSLSVVPKGLEYSS